VRGGLVRRHEAWVEDAVVVVYAAKILGRLVPELFRVVVAREVLHQVTLVPVELVDSVSELFDSREILDLRGSMFEVGRPVVLLPNVVRDVSLLLPLRMEHPLDAFDMSRLAKYLGLSLPQPVRSPLEQFPGIAALPPDVLAPVEPLEAPERRRHALPLACQRVHKPAVIVKSIFLRPDIVFRGWLKVVFVDIGARRRPGTVLSR